jgi:hypothetical protein
MLMKGMLKEDSSCMNYMILYGRNKMTEHWPSVALLEGNFVPGCRVRVMLGGPLLLIALIP